MPPRKQKRSGKPVVAPAETTVTRSQPQADGIKGSASTGTHNNGRCKLLEFPIELLREIISYLPAIAIPTGSHFINPVLPSMALERWDTLRALSQTCRLSRQVFFPILWERLEVCALRVDAPPQCVMAPNDMEPDLPAWRHEDMPKNWYKNISQRLERLSKALIADTKTAACVRIVNVSLTRCSTNTVLPAFVKCLESLPHVHTIQILHAHSQMTTMLKTHFEGHHLPTIRTVILPDHAHQILRICPEVRKVICNDGDGSKLVTAIAKECKYVEVLEGIRFSSYGPKSTMKRLIKACPNLRQIGINAINADDFALLSSLKNLAKIELGIYESTPDTYLQDPRIAPLLRSAKSVLEGSPTKERKTLSVRREEFKRNAWTVIWTRRVPLGDEND